MTTGTYNINGTELLLQPTEHRWLQRDPIDMTGDAHAVYPAIHQYELRWGIMARNEFDQLMGFYDAIASTGTVVVNLPKYRSTNYMFFAYSGCTLQEPYSSGWFAENLVDVVLIVEKIRV